MSERQLCGAWLRGAQEPRRDFFYSRIVKEALCGAHHTSSVTDPRARETRYDPPQMPPSIRFPSISKRGLSSAFCAVVTDATSKLGVAKIAVSFTSSAKIAARGSTIWVTVVAPDEAGSVMSAFGVIAPVNIGRSQACPVHRARSVALMASVVLVYRGGQYENDASQLDCGMKMKSPAIEPRSATVVIGGIFFLFYFFFGAEGGVGRSFFAGSNDPCRLVFLFRRCKRPKTQKRKTQGAKHAPKTPHVVLVTLVEDPRLVRS